MRKNWIAVLVGMTALGLAACSDGLDDGEDLIPLTAEEEVLPDKVAVQRIETLELGRLYDGYMLAAFGIAPGAGYYQPELAPRFGGRVGPDGFYEFDFVVRPPEDVSAGAAAPESARAVRADFELTTEMLRVSRGVRVWSARESVEGRF